MPTRVTIWNEYRHEKKNPKVAEVYPDGIHEALAAALRKEPGFEVRTATLDEPLHGLSDEVLNETDVMTWWGHMSHRDVSDEIVEKVYQRVLAGMGLIVLHSGHFSKIFKKLMGTSCDLKWREVGEREILWNTAPGHPILEGFGDHYIIAHEEMYGEFFDVPEPDETLLISGFTGGEVFRSGMTWRRGAGRIFYLRPGHELYPTFHNPVIQRLIANGIRWAAPTRPIAPLKFGNRKLNWVDEPSEGQ